MVVYNVGIVKTRIKSDPFEPIFCHTSRTYINTFKFIDSSSDIIDEINSISVDLKTSNYDEAINKSKKIFKHCKDILVADTVVYILFDTDTKNIIAITSAENTNGMWIDFCGNFDKVSFNRLGIDINNLIIY